MDGMDGAGNIAVRACEPEDEAGVIRCIVELQEFERALEPDRIEGERVAARAFRALWEAHRQHGGGLYVAALGDHVIGFVNVRVERDDQEYLSSLVEYAYISDIVVLPAYRGRGIGMLLLQRAEAFARQQGATVLKIQVLAKNLQAARVYQHAGFRPYEMALLKQLD